MGRKKEIGNQQKDSRKIGGKVKNSIEKNLILNLQQKHVNFCANLPTFASKPSYEPGLQVHVEIWTLSNIPNPTHMQPLNFSPISIKFF